MDFFTFFVLVCLIGLWVYARKIENRRREDAEKHSETAAALTARIHALEQQIKITWAAHTPAHTEAVPTPKTAEPLPNAPAVPAIHPMPKPPAPVSEPVATTSAPTAVPEPPKPKEAAEIPLIPAPLKEVAHPPIVSAAAAASVGPAKREIPGASHAQAAAFASHGAPPLTQGMANSPHATSWPAAQERVPFGSGPYVPTPAQKKSGRPWNNR